MQIKKENSTNATQFSPGKSSFFDAILNSSVGYFQINITKDLVENDFTFNENGVKVDVIKAMGFSLPCKFSDLTLKWYESFIPDNQKPSCSAFLNICNVLKEYYEMGINEIFFNYWTKTFTTRQTYISHRFVMLKNNEGDLCAYSIFNDITKHRLKEEESEQKKLENYAYTDALTGGRNYNKFKEDLKGIKKSGYIVAIDLRDFKLINSSCGIIKADQFLKDFWSCIELAVGKSNIAAHVYADHYIVYISSDEKSQVEKIIEHISLAENLMTIETEMPQVTPFYGIAKWEPGKSVEIAYSEAVAAKRKIKNDRSVSFDYFEEADTLRLIKEKMLEDSFENAIDNNEFEIFYQPKFSPANGLIVGGEALVRWRREGKLLGPGEFIPIFEGRGLIRELDEYVFKRVCRQQKKWKDEGIKIVPVSVNLSRTSLYYKGIVGKYTWIINEHELEADYVPIEITESAAVSNAEVKVIANTFARAGFKLHLDDFGAGYSSLSTLNDLPFDTLKIDKSLVDYIGNDSGNKLLKYTVFLAQELGMHVTAEGVENVKQNDYMRHIGCNSIQGYYYSKPVPEEDFRKMLTENHEQEIVSEVQKAQNYVDSLGRLLFKSSMNDILVNLTDNIFSVFDYGNIDWHLESDSDKYKYDKCIAYLAEHFVLPEYKEKFLDFFNRESLLNSYREVSESKILYYERRHGEDIIKVKCLINLFKVEGSDNLWMYASVVDVTDAC